MDFDVTEFLNAIYEFDVDLDDLGLDEDDLEDLSVDEANSLLEYVAANFDDDED